MKKILSILILVLSLTACGSMPQTDYQYTIDYTIGDASYTYQDIISLRYDYVPVYVLKNNSNEHSIVVRGMSGGSAYMFVDIVYEGGIPCTVNNFEYKPLRTYRVSIWDGSELKRALWKEK